MEGGLLEELLAASPHPLPFSASISELEVNTKSTLMKCASDTELGGVGDCNEDRAVMQSDPDCLVKRACGNKAHLNAKPCGEKQGMPMHVLQSIAVQEELSWALTLL